MRQIPDQVLELIAGGGSSDTSSIPSVTVPGPGGGGGGGGGWDPVPWDPYPYNPGGGGGGGGNPTEPDGNCLHTSPAPAKTPDGVSLNDLRTAVQVVSDTMKIMGINQYERGALIVRGSDGTLRSTEIATGDEDTNSISFTSRPGDSVVAWIHSHPLSDIDQRFPSTPQNSANHLGDTGMARQLLANSLFNPGMLMYILDAKTQQAYEYTASGGDKRALGNNISNDVVCG
ncbi:hypothetical protein SAMN05192549_105312 [Duganella sacchari]|uniref:Uncharacterized protein n=1 Tax=Duganella sacchari TaxID=551987 RepID=A0A1M7PQW3_9BURK|nr:hypothetical protein [Duganella sacchari]SHN19723.1 hypothetical protein SAMN05192549_105312 [Duganella sacchari]